MAISLVQTKTNGGSSFTGVNLAFASSNTAGNVIIVAVSIDSGATGTFTVTDTHNTYTKILETSTSSLATSLWYAFNIAGGANTVKVGTDGGFDVNAIAREYSGLTTTDPLDKTTFTTGTSTAPNSGATATTTQASELLVGVFGDSWGAGQTYTVGAGYGHLSTCFTNVAGWFVATEDQIVSSTGAYNATVTLGNSFNWIAGIATFKAAVTATAPVGKLFGSETSPPTTTLQAVIQASTR